VTGLFTTEVTEGNGEDTEEEEEELQWLVAGDAFSVTSPLISVSSVVNP
jgi:hypothetical protein